MSDQAQAGIKKNDQVRVTTGPFAGRTGLVLQVFLNQVTINPPAGRAFQVPAAVCAQTSSNGGNDGRKQ